MSARTAPSPGARSIGGVTIVGAGKAGLTLATALARWKLASLTMICRDAHRRAALERWIDRCQGSGKVQPPSVTSWRVKAAADASCGDTDTVLFATADRDLAAAAASWQAARAGRPGQIWLHLSGVSDPACLAVRGGADDLGSAHPLAALPDPLGRAAAPDGFPAVAQAVAPLQGAFFALAGTAAAMDRGDALARLVGGHPRPVGLAERPGYHAAAAVVANDLVGLMAVGEALAVAAGLGPAQSREALLHLARTSLEALAATATAPGASLAHGLTGAVGRGDAVTLAAHLDALAADHDGWLAHSALSRVLLGVVQRAGLLDDGAVAEVAKVLESGQGRH